MGERRGETDLVEECCPIAGHPVYRFSMAVIHSSMYLIPAESSCLVVDPCVSAEAEGLLRESSVRECLVLLTHEHYDHISGVNWLRERLPCQVVCSEKCAGRIADPRKNGAAYFEALTLRKSERERAVMESFLDAGYVCRADWMYSGQAELRWKDLTLNLREAPGHSPGSQIIEVGKHWYFTGDSLIPGERIITRLPGGSRKAYEEETRPYLEAIAPESILFPGHGGETIFSGQISG